MPMVAPAKLWTIDEVRALPDDGRRFELIDGTLIVNGVVAPDGDLASLDPAMTPSPSWTHQMAVPLMWQILHSYVTRHRIGYAIVAPADVLLGATKVVQPDVFVVPSVGGVMPRDWAEAGRVLLAVEVLSLSSARTDRILKREFYLREGVPEYWIVDVNTRAVERWRQGDTRAELLGERLEWSPPGAIEPLVIDLDGYFSSVAPTHRMK